MKTMIAHIKQAGATFKIPVQVNDEGEMFCNDVVVNQQEDEDTISEDEKAAAWFEAEAEKQRLSDERNFPTAFSELF